MRLRINEKVEELLIAKYDNDYGIMKLVNQTELDSKVEQFFNMAINKNNMTNGTSRDMYKQSLNQLQDIVNKLDIKDGVKRSHKKRMITIDSNITQPNVTSEMLDNDNSHITRRETMYALKRLQDITKFLKRIDRKSKFILKSLRRLTRFNRFMWEGRPARRRNRDLDIVPEPTYIKETMIKLKLRDTIMGYIEETISQDEQLKTLYSASLDTHVMDTIINYIRYTDAQIGRKGTQVVMKMIIQEWKQYKQWAI